MRKFIEEHELEVLLIFFTFLGIARWWMPEVQGFEKMYAASHWVLSYDYGLIRRGLVGSILKLWSPIVTIPQIHLIASIVYYLFLFLLLALSLVLLRLKDFNRGLFRLLLIFLANPATLPLLARDLGRFDIFLVIITFFSMIILWLNRYLWLIPILMLIAMLIHEGFLILFAPTILSAILFIYSIDKREKKKIAIFSFSLILMVATFFILYRYGHPKLGYEEFFTAVQSRADFSLTPLSIRECYFAIGDHYSLASSSLYDAGSIANFFVTLLIISPVFLILLNLWEKAFRNCKAHGIACWLFLLSTFSGALVIPIATDYGRWLSGIIFCNFFAILFLISKGIITVEELREYEEGLFKVLFVSLLVMYLLFGPINDWNPYPYKDNLLFSSFAITIALLFDFGFLMRWRLGHKTNK